MENEKVDEEFVETMLEIEKCYISMSKHEKVRIEQWSKKLCQVTANPLWKKNRNKYAKTLLQLVKLGSLQEPFTKSPPEGPLPQFNGQVFIQPAKPRPRSSAVGHLNRVQSNSESFKQLNLKPESKIMETPSFESKVRPELKANFALNSDPKPAIYKVSSNKSFENVNFKNIGEKYDTKIQISTKVNEECIRLQTKLEIFQINEKHLREELSKKNRKIQEQAEEIDSLKQENGLLKRENDSLKSKPSLTHVPCPPSKPHFEEVRSPYRYFLEKQHSDEDLLNIDDISHNLKRLEKLQEDLNKNKFS